jgi:hypothetical protein
MSKDVYIYKSGQKKLSIVRLLEEDKLKKWMDEKKSLKFASLLLGIELLPYSWLQNNLFCSHFKLR